MSERHIVRANVFNIDTNEYEEQEFEVSDDVYKIITNGIGASYSIGVRSDDNQDQPHIRRLLSSGVERTQARTDSED